MVWLLHDTTLKTGQTTLGDRVLARLTTNEDKGLAGRVQHVPDKDEIILLHTVAGLQPGFDPSGGDSGTWD